MNKTFWRIVTLLLCCVMLAGIVACNKDDETKPSESSSAGESSNPGTSSTPGTSSGPGTSDSPGSSATPDSGPPKRDYLNVAYFQDGGTLDPLYNVGWDFLSALRMIYEPLWEQFGQDENLAYRWVLAESTEGIENGYGIRVHLRKDAYFASGNQVTAEDVLFTLDKANNRTGVSAFFRTLDDEKTKVVDEFTIDMIFTELSVDHMAGFSSFFIFDRLSYDADTIAMTPVGSGPYKVDDYIVGSHFNISLRDDYWGGKVDAIPKIFFKKLTEEAQRVNALITGDVDIAQVPYVEIDFVNDTIDNIEVSFFSGDTTAAIHMSASTERDVFSKLGTDARKAVALAIDRQAIVNVAYSGYANVSRFPLSAGTADAFPELFDQGIYGMGYNPTLAKELAESSGLVNCKPLLINNGGPVQVLISEIIQMNLASIGVDIEVQTLDQGSWLSFAFDSTQWDMAVDFTFGSTCAGGYRTWYRMIGGYNTNPWPGSDRFDEIIEGPPAITEISDYSILNEYYKELTAIHVESIPWYVICDVLVPMAHDKDLKGWKPMRSGNIIYTDLSW
ncbi:MAG: ABC transporter substrate-binding protein [Oscillospiraceae bacterium]|nr:ABC transporter substrate-binding protein [Oscillospiraceae bacterium]